ncbi:hypothetical protein JCM1841_003667 [Sporobolomyces salmonicolor]
MGKSFLSLAHRGYRILTLVASSSSAFRHSKGPLSAPLVLLGWAPVLTRSIRAQFFRFMSERYPLISQLIQENRIPEFDALYLDMNGIIHNCSHPNDNDATYRISEEAIFLAIFAYVSHLFSVIKPQKLFFLAIDGVAPRAKMNQQRSRRFRTAKEAKEAVEKAKRRGEEIPEEEGFDSNCITPGTPFMARLSAQLKYFIAKKVSEDADWKGVEIVLSGHEVPGEGEHKIMEYIRLAKAQPGYDPNMRHCLYGLDADLIMLGLLSHDPHFCLLREEVTFGPRGGKGKAKSLESQNFFLMHLSLFREYLDLEFSSLKSLSPPLPFEYDLERIIDDFILLNIFVGNDFLPHLPGLHINEGALNRLFEIYKRVLPQAGGYLNEHGVLNVQRLQLVLDELTVFEKEHFEYEFADANWFKGKQGGGGAIKAARGMEKAMEKAKAKGKLVLTQTQKAIFTSLQAFLLSSLASLSTASSASLQFPNDLSSRDKRFLSDLADELRLVVTYDEFNDAGENLVSVRFDDEMLRLAKEEEEDEEEEGVSTEEEEGDESSEAEEIGIVHLSLNDGSIKRHARSHANGTKNGAREKDEAEWQRAIRRVLRKYEKAEVAQEFNEEDWEVEHERQVQEKMEIWKRDYYKEKLEFDHLQDQQALHDLAYRYIEGLQWVLHYYYSGVASWGWFYNYHYAPKISDLKHAATYKFKFDIGTPFRPFEQLMGVLPDLSSQHIPLAFRDLMSDPTSPIIDFYPTTFEQDLNGKKQDWEAIVKIPFIDEKRLLATMKTREPRLTHEERKRNSYGESWRFVYDDAIDQTYPSSLPGFFPDLVHNHTRLEAYHLPTLEGGLQLVKGLAPGVLLGKDAVSGFPSLDTIPHTAALGFHGVNVFQSDSRRETMVVSLDSAFEGLTSEQVARLVGGKRIFVGYPYLREALVEAVSDELFRYELDEVGRVIPTPHSQGAIIAWKRSADKIEHVYSKSRACLIGHVEVIVHARPLKGLKRQDDGSTVKEWEDDTEDFALQATVRSVSSEDVRYTEQPPIPVEIEYPEGSKVFFLGVAYGVPAQVVGHDGDQVAIRIAFFPNDKAENNLFKTRLASMREMSYVPAHALGRMVRMSGLTLSKITSSLLLLNGGDQRVNVGLNLKFEAKGQKVLGYSRKGDSGWEFSQRAIQLITEYRDKFPEIVQTLDTNRGDLTRATDFFDPSVVDQRMKELVSWIKEKGVRDFEKVPLYSEQLDKDAVQLIEKLSDKLVSQKTQSGIKQALIKAIPRQALLKPAHAPSRLREQQFALGDRVVTVVETGSVPLSAKGVVVGIQSNLVDVVFDVQFMSGTTLGDRCSPYRGATVAPHAILNLTNPQFVQGANGAVAPPVSAAQPGLNKNAKFKAGPRGGPAILPAQGLPAGGFHPAPSAGRGRGRIVPTGGVQVLRNPTRTVSPATAFNAVANGTAPTPTPSAPAAGTTPQTFTHQQRLGQTLGIRGGSHPLRGGPQFGRGGFAVPPPQVSQQGQGQVFRNHPAFVGGVGHHPGVPAAGAVHLAAGGGGGRGVAIPPPASLMHPAAAAGRGRGGTRGGRGRGGARGGMAPAAVAAAAGGAAKPVKGTVA